jgi:hypothetical protein
MMIRFPVRIWFTALSLVVLLLLVHPVSWAAAANKATPSVPPCRGVTLSASYLAELGHGQGPGFQFSLVNNTAHEVKVREPVPSSAHWYALSKVQNQDRWLWRASSGAGGSLVDATNERGPLAAYQSPEGGVLRGSFSVKPHESRQWLESEAENPVLEYKPGCPICSYPGERQYRVVFAYAYLPADKENREGLLSCGLRSSPVPMPPKP